MTLLNIAQSGGGMGRYLEEAKRFPMLRPDQEQDLALAWRDRRDEEALRQLTGSLERPHALQPPTGERPLPPWNQPPATSDLRPRVPPPRLTCSARASRAGR